jgi:uncharacterized protein (DUF2236 family)
MTYHDEEQSEFLAYLRDLGEQADPQAGFFGPDSLVWQISREPVLLLFGMRALLLQIAHPYVAQGVADHSDYRSHPLGRGIRTFKAVYAMVFGPRDAAIDAALAVHGVHDRVFGEVTDRLPTGIDPYYSANDPQALLWVAATLLDSSVQAYELCIRSLSDTEKEQYYQESKLFGQLFGIPHSLYPDTWVDFKEWMRNSVQNGRIFVTPTAREILQGLLSATLFTRLLAPVNYSVAAMSLPAELAEQFGLKRTKWTKFIFQTLIVSAKMLMRVLPQMYRGVPAARRSERRLRRLKK